MISVQFHGVINAMVKHTRHISSDTNRHESNLCKLTGNMSRDIVIVFVIVSFRALVISYAFRIEYEGF